MLSRIPTISEQGSNKYIDSIDSKHSLYENLKDAPMMLELALWKSKIIEQFDKNNSTPLTVDMKKRCQTDSLSMVAMFVPNVLSFLTDGDAII